jgi:hypothetical protein
MPPAIISGAYLLIGLGLWFQPGRWDRTPAYGILLDIFSQQLWGTLYIVAAIAMAVSVWVATNRVLSITAHIAAISLTTVWLTAFIVRYLTDASTTVVNPVNWSVLLAVLVYSALLTDKQTVEPVHPPAHSPAHSPVHPPGSAQ